MRRGTISECRTDENCRRLQSSQVCPGVWRAKKFLEVNLSALQIEQELPGAERCVAQACAHDSTHDQSILLFGLSIRPGHLYIHIHAFAHIHIHAYMPRVIDKCFKQTHIMRGSFPSYLS